MWWWITEDWRPAAMLFGALAAILLFTWSVTHRGLHMVLAVASLALVPVAYVVDEAYETDAEQVERRTLELTDAFEREDRDALEGLFGHEGAALEAMVYEALERVDVRDDLRVTDLSVDVEPGGQTATIHFRANATVIVVGHGDFGYQPSRWRLTWEREEGDWRVVAAQRLNPVDGTEMGTFESRR